MGAGVEKLEYSPALTGLRALCALAVVARHTAKDIFPGGAIGVDVFFVLSGFLITRLLLTEHGSTGGLNLPRFYLRRMVRLWPVLLLVIAVYTPYIMLTRDGWDQITKVRAVLPAALYYINWCRALDVCQEGNFGHMWSLAVEEQFYLLWPVLLGLALMARRPWLWVAALLALALPWPTAMALLGASGDRIYNGFDTRAAALLFGCILAFAPDRSRLYELAGRTWLAPAAALVAATLLPRAESVWAMAWSFPVVAALAAWLIAGIRAAEPRVLAWGPMVYLGTISYGVYLWHYPIRLELTTFMEGTPGSRFLIVSFLAIALSAASYELMEKRARRIGNRWINRYLPARTFPAPPVESSARQEPT